MRKTETVALLSQKGGVGKTTTAVNIGAGLAILGERVLLIDLDPQAHLTHTLRVLGSEVNGTTYDVLRGETNVLIAATRRQLRAKVKFADRDAEIYLTVVPSNLNLAGAEVALAKEPGKEFLLREALDGATQDFDCVIIDCPPSLGLLSVNALVAATKVLIPVQVEYLALESVGKLQDVIEVVKTRLNPSLELAGVIATRFDGRKILNREIVAELKDRFGSLFFDTKIRENIAIAEAPRCGEDIFTYRPRSYGAEDYLHLCEEILQRNRRNDLQDTTVEDEPIDPGYG